MKAVIFNGPYNVSVEQRPIPVIIEPTDVIVKVKYTALCGSELHVFRGHQKSPTGFIMGHEFTGEIVSVGEEVKNFHIGDKIVSPFTCSCMDCFYCKDGATSRCKHSKLFGSQLLDGAQAEYVRVPLADGTLFLAPEDENLEKKLVLMADIFPTGYFAASNALKDLTEAKKESSVNVVIGCGPVGLCAIVAAKSMTKTVYAIDTVPERLEEAKSLGAIPLNLTTDDPISVIKEATDGRGADTVMEIVGLSPALRLAYDLVRPWGKISSVGVHNAEIPFTGNEAYNKNISIQFGRCPVRSIFAESFDLFKKSHKQLDCLSGHIMKLDDAVEAYDLFEKKKIQKIIFEI
jgi:threonine dehydrogenase-like Zn-dependent dehydrogenase